MNVELCVRGKNMKYDVIISIDNNKNNGIIVFDENKFSLKVKDKCKDIEFKDILAFKQVDYNSFSILLSNKKVIIIQSEKDIILSNIFFKWRSNNDSTIKINLSTFRSVYIFGHPITTLLIMSMIFILVYDGLVGVSLSNSLEINPIVAFFSGMVFGFFEYQIDFIQIILIISTIVCIALEIVFQKRWIKEIEDILNNKPLPDISKTEKLNTNDKYEELEKLKELLDKNIITEEEFNIKKKEILKLEK